MHIFMEEGVQLFYVTVGSFGEFMGAILIDFVYLALESRVGCFWSCFSMIIVLLHPLLVVAYICWNVTL